VLAPRGLPNPLIQLRLEDEALPAGGLQNRTARTVRLFHRDDTVLVGALIAALVVIFERPMQWLLTLAQEAEQRYHVDLVPGLVVLAVAFFFHEYRKRMSASAAVTAPPPVAAAPPTAAVETPSEPSESSLPGHTDDLQQLVAFGRAVEVAQARARADELQRLVAFGRAVAQAVEPAALKQVLWRYLPVFARDRAFWVLTRRDQQWDAHLQDFRIAGQSNEELERIASDALAQAGAEADGPGVLVSENLCFPLVVGDTPVGVLGVQNTPPLSADERRALGAVVALIAIAIRNMQRLVETRDYSVRDRLTGCSSRAHGLDTLKAELARARRTRHPLSVVMFDVDHFKTINDKFGHVVGDSMLEAVGQSLNRVLRVSDVKCRYGGDEFLILLPETPVSGAVHAADSMLREIGRLRLAAGEHVVNATVSIGVAAAMPGELNPETLIARVDDALYQAKRGGRNRYVVAADPRVPPAVPLGFVPALEDAGRAH
jgi:diguanylate cyclase (GGDEF)-like protein